MVAAIQSKVLIKFVLGRAALAAVALELQARFSGKGGESKLVDDAVELRRRDLGGDARGEQKRSQRDHRLRPSARGSAHRLG